MVWKTLIPPNGLSCVSKTSNPNLNPITVDGLQSQNRLDPFCVIHYGYEHFALNVPIKSVVILLLIWCHRMRFAWLHELFITANSVGSNSTMLMYTANSVGSIRFSRLAGRVKI